MGTKNWRNKRQIFFLCTKDAEKSHTITNVKIHTWIFKTNSYFRKEFLWNLNKKWNKILNDLMITKITTSAEIISALTSTTISSISHMSIRSIEECLAISRKTPPSPPPITKVYHKKYNLKISEEEIEQKERIGKTYINYVVKS